MLRSLAFVPLRSCAGPDIGPRESFTVEVLCCCLGSPAGEPTTRELSALLILSGVVTFGSTAPSDGRRTEPIACSDSGALTGVEARESDAPGTDAPEDEFTCNPLRARMARTRSRSSTLHWGTSPCGPSADAPLRGLGNGISTEGESFDPQYRHVC